MVIFSSLNTLSGNGGIEKFNRSLISALDKRFIVRSLALHDASFSEYRENHKGYSGSIIHFAISFLWQCIRTDKIILGHLNLAPVALLSTIFFPKKKYFLVIHGLELWLPLSFFKKQLLKRVDKCITVSSFSSQRLQRIGIPREKIQILHNTVGVNDYPVVQSQSNLEQWKSHYTSIKNSFIMLTTARMSSNEGYKGYDRVIKSLPIILKKIPNIHYVLVGKYDEQEKQRLDNLINQYQVQNHVTFTGFVSEDELRIWMTQSNLFIMPSTMEGFGIVYIEAMASGTPVIAGNKDGSVDALAGGELGMLVDPESVDEIANAVIHIHNNYEHVLKGEALRAAVIRKFGFEVFSKKVEEIFS
ncbi:glycosyltransferase family 4 protein [Luteibaculum oceani]|uniref:Glycosyltransferase family 4 protein n=1 Tax=Luteibaculum oceani TaxID=1294296 RepID=A0A5C6VE96_9FLAO|nr:glycosyltransferase family 4 protein [Luteibaculum oceani]TXC81398.1 glycosyltransferase family 4 protein [Luteibaculum oceani]